MYNVIKLNVNGLVRWVVINMQTNDSHSMYSELVEARQVMRDLNRMKGF